MLALSLVVFALLGILLGRAALRYFDQKREAFRARVVREFERTEYPLVYQYGLHTITIEREKATISDGIPESFTYDSIYLVSRKRVSDSPDSWSVHIHAGEASRAIGFLCSERSEGELAMRVLAHKAGAPIELIE